MSSLRANFVWMDGALVPWDEANVHIMTHTLHYGLGMFEGIRCYQRADGRSHIFRHREHIRRLFESATWGCWRSPTRLRRSCRPRVTFCGTAAEITPVRMVDNRKIGGGKVGPVSGLVQSQFFEVVKGAREGYDRWFDYL